jgi:hypothetical protein
VRPLECCECAAQLGGVADGPPGEHRRQDTLDDHDDGPRRHRLRQQAGLLEGEPQRAPREAARAAGLDRVYLYRLLWKYGLKKGRDRLDP